MTAFVAWLLYFKLSSVRYDLQPFTIFQWWSQSDVRRSIWLKPTRASHVDYIGELFRFSYAAELQL